MSVSIHYRGGVAEPNRIRELRDYLIDFADQANWECLNLTGQDESEILEIILYPPGHCEPVFFLFDTEGRLHPPYAYQDAENALWCSVKTEYGPVEAHVQIVELLRQIQRQFIPQLEVSDEGRYWETANLDHLQWARDFLAQQITLLSRHLEQHGSGTLRNVGSARLTDP